MYTTRERIKDYIYHNTTKSYSIFSGINSVNVESFGLALFDYGSIIIDEKYAGENTFVVEFVDATNYNIFRTEKGVSKNLYIGSSDTSSLFVLPDMISIPSTVFSGVLAAKDKFTFTISRSIALTDLDNLIELATIEVDSYALSTQKIPWRNTYEDRVFGNLISEVPSDIILATTMWTVAFMIETGKLQQTSNDNPEGFNRILKNSARKKIDQAASRLSSQTPVLPEDPDTTTEGATISTTHTDLVVCTTTNFVGECC